MAPEQLDPDRNGPITVQTDVYGLGGILYFTLYGKAPNESLSMTKKDILESLATGKGSPTRGRLQFTERSSRKLAKRLEPICLRALNRDLARRHESVMEFTKDLVGALML
jgi:serine/threonine protein kinase